MYVIRKHRSYCRSTGENLKIDSCASRREGRLCGRCQPGYSEAWFSTLCVPNDDCGPVWLYALATTLVHCILDSYTRLLNVRTVYKSCRANLPPVTE